MLNMYIDNNKTFKMVFFLFFEKIMGLKLMWIDTIK